jgi:hypothetical protein
VKKRTDLSEEVAVLLVETVGGELATSKEVTRDGNDKEAAVVRRSGLIGS